MTLRDRTALAFLVAGSLGAIAVAGSYGGVRAAAAALVVIVLFIGVLLALGDAPTAGPDAGETEV